LLRKDRSKSHSKGKATPNLITRKRSAQAGNGGGLKKRSSRTLIYALVRIRTAHSDWKAAGSESRIAVSGPPS
jgi:hypothetical protein